MISIELGFELHTSSSVGRAWPGERSPIKSAAAGPEGGLGTLRVRRQRAAR